jgi:hypothetical protein
VRRKADAANVFVSIENVANSQDVCSQQKLNELTIDRWKDSLKVRGDYYSLSYAPASKRTQETLRISHSWLFR